jgi:hypothetical protein
LSLNASAVGADNACTAGEKMEIQSAYVDLYNTNNPAVRERLDFNTSTLRMNIEDISVSNGDVIGLNTVLEIYFDDEWSVEWFGDWAKPSQTSLLTGVATGYQKYNYGLYLVDGVAELRASSTFSNNIFGCKVDEVPICVSEITPTVTFTRLDTPPTVVPEPTSMALFFGALGAAGWVRRRKSRQA